MAMSLILFTIGLHRADEHRQAFAQYFGCEAVRYDPQAPCDLQVDRRDYITLNIAAIGIFAFAPYITFIYIIPFQKVKSKLGSLSTS